MNMKGVMYTVILLLAATMLVLPVSGAFTVTGISPDRGNNTDWVYVDVTGTELPDEFSVVLTNGPAGTSNITGQYNHFYNAEWISCFFDLDGQEAGARTVVVVNKSEGSEAVLEGTPFLEPVQFCVMCCGGNGFSTLIHHVDMRRAGPRRVQPETANETEAVEHLATGRPRHQRRHPRIVHLLVQVQPGLVPAQQVHLKPQAVQFDLDGAGQFPG